MKISAILPVSLLTLTIICFGCQQKKEVKDQMKAKTTVCYQAIAGKDTAWLKIDTAGIEVVGFLTFNYEADKDYDGEFKGKMYGDTLKGHYDFKVNKVDKWYRNPVAFLIRDGKLTMGVGNFNMVWGSAFFDPKVPINYEQGKFVFERGGCEVKITQ